MKTLLAVSGGIDSMCMADIYSRTDEDYAIAHCNFHLRGEDSNADAELVQKWARTHGVRFFCADFDTAGYARENGISIEMAAREQRYAWFVFIAETQGFDAVATAHNANDNAETLILNLLRGTGSRGLRGISPTSSLPGSSAWQTRATLGNVKGRGPFMGGAERSEAVGRTLTPGKNAVKLIRPMLEMSRADIEKYAQEHDIPYREDRTNAESIYKRNRIRNIIFPEFEKINPSFIRTLNADIDRFRQVDDIAEDYYLQNAVKVFDGQRVDVTELLHLRHWRYILFRVLEPFGFSEDVLASVNRMLAEMAGGKENTFSGRCFHSSEYTLETATGSMFILRNDDFGKEDTIIVPGPGTYRFNGKDILVEEFAFDPGMELKQEKGVLICDACGLGFPFILRKWKAGDWMRPFGMNGKMKKVSDIFTDMKLPVHKKEEAVIVASWAGAKDDKSHIAAIAGHRMDEALRISKGSERIVRISIL